MPRSLDLKVGSRSLEIKNIILKNRGYPKSATVMKTRYPNHVLTVAHVC